MLDIPAGLLWLGLGYLVGGVPAAYLFGRWRGHDLLATGNGTPGSHAVAATLGLRAALLTGVVDMAKGLSVVWWAQTAGVEPLVADLAGVAAVVGHIWSPYLRLRGGRGLVTALGVALYLAPWELLAGFTFLLLSKVFLRDAAPGAFVGVLAVAAATWLLQEPDHVRLTIALLCAIIFVARLAGPRRDDLLRRYGRVPRSPSVLFARLIWDRDSR